MDGPIKTFDYGTCIVINELDDDLRCPKRFWRYVDKIFIDAKSDNCDRFVRLVRHEHTSGFLRKEGFVLCPSLLLSMLIDARALRCAEALLSGTTGVLVDVDAAPNLYACPPIFTAATKFLPEFVILLLKYGARLDIKCRNPRVTWHLMLPLDAAIDKLSGEISWTSQSVDDLISTICCTKKHVQGCLSIGHMMRALPVEETQEAIMYHVRNINIVELAILLFSDALCGLRMFQSMPKVEYSVLRQFIAENLLASYREDNACFIVSSHGVRVSTIEKELIKSMMQLLDIFYHMKFPVLVRGSEHNSVGKSLNSASHCLTEWKNVDGTHEATNIVKLVQPVVHLQSSVSYPMALKSRATQTVHPRSFFPRSFHGICFEPRKFLELQSYKSIAAPTNCPHTPTYNQAAQIVNATHEGLEFVRSCSFRRTWTVLASATKRMM